MTGKRRSEMTSEELAHVRQLDKERKQKARLGLNEEEKEKIRAKDRERRAEARQKLKEEQKEKIRAIERERRANAWGKLTEKGKDKENITKLIRMRKNRLIEDEESKRMARNKAKEGRKVLRRDGPMRKYFERTKKHSWAVKWKKFLSQNPMYRVQAEKKKN